MAEVLRDLVGRTYPKAELKLRKQSALRYGKQMRVNSAQINGRYCANKLIDQWVSLGRLHDELAQTGV